MLASRQHSWELAWWALVAILALMLVALASQTALYGEPVGDRTAPRPMVAPMSADEATETWCQGVEAFRNGEFARAGHAFDTIARAQESGMGDPALHVWRTLAAHGRGDRTEAIRGWRTAPLDMNAEVWRHLGLAALALDKGQLDDAGKSLDTAWELDRDHAVVRYLTGLLNLERAHRANVWEDRSDFPFRLASWRPPMAVAVQTVAKGRPIVAPNTASMYRLAAIADLEKAVELAPQLLLDAPLVATDAQVALAPRTSDVLKAMGAAELEANCEVMLGQLYLENDHPWQAEQHFDAATRLGRTTPFGYQEVAAAYQHENRFCEAAMASAKAFRSRPDSTTCGQLTANVLRSVGQFLAW